MQTAKITSSGKTTIPVAIRKAAHLACGDTLLFEMKEDYVAIKKITNISDPYLTSISTTLHEWDSLEDEEAWHEL